MFAYIEGPYPYSGVLAFAFLFGILSGLLYECFRILRCVLITVFPMERRSAVILHAVLVSLADILFFMLVTVAAVLFLFAFNRGQLRVSLVVAMMLGFTVYFLTLGKLFLRFHKFILHLLYHTVLWIYHYTLRYVLILIGIVWRRTLGRAAKYLKVSIMCLWRKYYLARMRHRLNRLIAASENAFSDMGDYISLY